jgi:hypothetical protein
MAVKPWTGLAKLVNMVSLIQVTTHCPVQLGQSANQELKSQYLAMKW